MQLVFSSCVTSKHHKNWFFHVSSLLFLFLFFSYSIFTLERAWSFYWKVTTWLYCIYFFGKAVREKKGLNCLPEENFRCFLYSCIILLFLSCHEVFSLLNIILFCIQILYEGEDIHILQGRRTKEKRISKALIARNGIKSLETFSLSLPLFSLYCNLWYLMLDVLTLDEC